MEAKKAFRRLFAALLIVFVVPWVSSAQVISGSAQTTASGGFIEASGNCGSCTSRVIGGFAGVGDLDKDGKADMAVTETTQGIVYFVKGPGPATGSTIDVLTGAAFSRFTLPSGTLTLGMGVAPAGDLDHDGNADVLVSVPNALGKGVVYVLYGPITGSMTPSSPRVATLVGETDSQFGYAVAAAGDVNNDGKDDLLIGAPGLSTHSGGAYLVRGPFAGTISMPAGAAAKMTGPTGSRAGSAVAAGRDLFDTATPDFVIGAYDYDAQGALDIGATFVISGSRTGTLPLLGSGAVFFGQSAHDRSGWAVAVGNVTGTDNHADLIIGAPGNYYTGVSGGDGAVFIVPGPVTTEPTQLPGRGTNKLVGAHWSNAGWSLTTGYFNVDGPEDLAVGAPNYSPLNSGAVYVLFGPISPSLPDLSGANAIRTGAPGFGFRVNSPGDVDHACGGDLMAGWEATNSVFVDHQTACGAASGLLVPIVRTGCSVTDPTHYCFVDRVNQDLVYGRFGL